MKFRICCRYPSRQTGSGPQSPLTAQTDASLIFRMLIAFSFRVFVVVFLSYIVLVGYNTSPSSLYSSFPVPSFRCDPASDYSSSSSSLYKIKLAENCASFTTSMAAASSSLNSSSKTKFCPSILHRRLKRARRADFLLSPKARPVIAKVAFMGSSWSASPRVNLIPQPLSFDSSDSFMR